MKVFPKIYFRNRDYDSEKEATKVFKEIYSKGKSSDSSGDFGFKRTRETNSRTLCKI